MNYPSLAKRGEGRFSEAYVPLYIGSLVNGLIENDLGIRFHEVGGWVVELIRLRSNPALGDLSRKSFCGYSLHSS
jgi:hypothetical protein